jgi:hypothetical protein
VRPFARLAQFVDGAPGDDLLAEGDEGLKHLLQVQHLRPAVIERQHVDAEGRLQRGEAVELIQHHFRHGVAPQLDHHAHAVPVGLVADVGDALDDLGPHKLRQAFLKPGLVHLVGDLGHDDRRPVLPALLHMRARAHDDRAAAEMIGLADAGPAEDAAAGREIGTWDDLDQPVDRDLRIVDHHAAGVYHLGQIMGRDVGRHADGDPAGAIHQQIREPCGENGRLLIRIVIVRLELDRVLLDIVEQRGRGARQPRLGVPHRRRRIAIHRAEIALALDEGQAHGEVLRHADHRLVDRIGAMGMVLTDHIADHARRFAERPVPVVAALAHRVEDAPVHGLEAVAHVGQRSRHDHAHRVIEVGALHLLLDRDRGDVEIRAWSGGQFKGPGTGFRPPSTGRAGARKRPPRRRSEKPEKYSRIGALAQPRRSLARARK